MQSQTDPLHSFCSSPLILMLSNLHVYVYICTLIGLEITMYPILFCYTLFLLILLPLLSSSPSQILQAYRGPRGTVTAGLNSKHGTIKDSMWSIKPDRFRPQAGRVTGRMVHFSLTKEQLSCLWVEGALSLLVTASRL